MLSCGGYHQWDLSSTQQNQPTANLNLLMIKLQVTGALFSELIPTAIISLSNFTLMDWHSSKTMCNPHSCLFPGDYDGLLRWPFPKVIHLSFRDQLDPLNAWTQKSQPTREPPSDNRPLLSRTTHSLLSSTNTSHILNFSAKLTDTL